VGVDDAGVREYRQKSIQAEDVKRGFQEPSLSAPLLLQRLELALVMAIARHSVAAIKPFPVHGKVERERKVLGLEGHELQVNAFGRIVRREGVLVL
jgi:hypothetical protein